MRSRRGSLVGLLLVSFLLGSVVIAGIVIGGSPAVATNTTETALPHTVVITSDSGPVSYTVTASTGLHLKRGEQNDYQLRGPRVSGTVGESGDSKDVIRYRGYIESFQAAEGLRVTLDGERIAPTVLAGQHIRITRPPNTSLPVRYRFGVTGAGSRGELAEQDDTAHESRIRGIVRDTGDSFYITGTITNDLITLSGPATVTINGQNASVFLSNSPPTAPAPTPTVARPSPTQSSSRALSPTPVPPPSVDSPDRRDAPSVPRGSPTALSAHSATSGGAGLLSGLDWLESFVLGIVVVLAVAGVGVLLLLSTQ